MTELWYLGGMPSGAGDSYFGQDIIPLPQFGDIILLPFLSVHSHSVDKMQFVIRYIAFTPPIDSFKVRLGIYTQTSANNLYPGALLTDTGDVTVTVLPPDPPGSFVAYQPVPITLVTPVVLPQNTYCWLAMRTDDVSAQHVLLPVTPYLCGLGWMDDDAETHASIILTDGTYGPFPDPLPDGAVFSGHVLPALGVHFSS